MTHFDDEKIILGLAFIALLIIYVNVDPTLGNLYLILIFGFMGFFAIEKENILQIAREYKKSSLVLALFLTAVFITLIGIFQMFYTGGLFSLTAYADILQIESIFTTTSREVQLFIFGILIPVVETLGLIAVLYVFTKVFKVRIMQLPDSWEKVLKDKNSQILATAVGLTLALLHGLTRLTCITSGCPDPNLALFTDFSFFYFSTLVGIRYKRALEIMLMHIYINVPAFLKLIGVF